jgi:hypothetical protein
VATYLSRAALLPPLLLRLPLWRLHLGCRFKRVVERERDAKPAVALLRGCFRHAAKSLVPSPERVRWRAVYLAYMDESGDPGPSSAVPTYTVGLVFVHARDWVTEFERLLTFRRYLRRVFGLKLRVEVKGSELAKGTGPWVSLALRNRTRKRIYRSFMRLQNRGGVIKSCAIVIDKSDSRTNTTDTARERAWRYTLQRVEHFATDNNETVMLVPDSGQYHWIRGLAREMRRFSFVGSAIYPGTTLRRDLLQILIDDPVDRNSEESFFIQLADLNAYAAYRNRRPDPAFPVGLWNELGGAILREANSWQMRTKGGTWGIVDGP